VISHQAPLTSLGDQIDALLRIGAIPNDVAKGKNPINASTVDIRQHCFERREIRVDIADECSSHRFSRMILRGKRY
jgi:hypothetical protein